MHIALLAIGVLFILLLLGAIVLAQEMVETEKREEARRLALLPQASLIYDGPCPLCYRTIRVSNIRPSEAS